MIRRIINISLRISFFIIIALILLPMVTYIIEPRHIIDFSTNPVDQKLYADISFGPIETYFPLFKIGFIAQYSRPHLFLLWSPNGNHFAYMANLSESERTPEKYYAIIVLNPRTFQRKTVLITDEGNFAWLDNDTIRYFRGAGTGVGVYRDININTKNPFIVANYNTPVGWQSVTLKEMSEMREQLAKLSR